MNKLILKCLLLLFSIGVVAQTGDIRGFVYDESNGEPIIFTNVVLEGTTMGATTDINGFYSITKVEPGTYTVVCSYIGYETAKAEVVVESGGIVNQKLFLKTGGGVDLDVVEISADKQEATTEVKTSVIKVSPKQINKIPSVGGAPDLAQYLQVLPGIVFTGDQGGQLYVRGGSPIQTKVLLDGLRVYNPFHSIGLFSVYETDLIKNVDVLTGGFGAEYGGAISAVVDVATKDGNKKELEGSFSANPLMSKLVIQGPLKPLGENGNSISYILAIKNSYLDRSSPIFYPYINAADDPENLTGVEGLPYNFNDVYGKISFNSRSGNKLSLFGYNFQDNTNFEQVYKWRASGGGGNAIIVPGRSKFLIDTKFAYSSYNVDLSGTVLDDKYSAVNGFNLIVDLNYFLPRGKMVYGIDIAGFRTDFNFTDNIGIYRENRQNTTEIAAYFMYKAELGKLVIEPSLRLVNYASLSNFQLEPRFGLKYNVTKKLRFKLAAGRYTQNLISTKSDRDVVALFTGFLSAPEEELFTYDGEETNGNIQIANHAIVGFEVDVTKRINLNIEGYYKDFEQLININRNQVFPDDPEWVVEDGEAYGVDFLAKYDYKRLYVWGVYSLGFVKRTGPNGQGGVATYPPHFDRRHNLNFLTTYVLGADKDWEASVRWNLGSGFPFTQTQGFYEAIDFSNGLNTDYLSENGSLGVLYSSELNGGRLPYYHRLDFSVKKKFTLGANVNLDVVASITNVYNRANIFYFDRIEYTRVNQLPILPSIGFNLKF